MQQEAETQEFKPGWPPFILNGGALVVFEVKMANGEIIKATVDSSTQYRAEGLQWRDADTRWQINRDAVVGWREFKKQE